MEVVTAATLGDIVKTLDSDLTSHEKKIWFDELFNRSIFLGNDECLQTVKEHIELMTMANCKAILNYIKDVSNSDAELEGNENGSVSKMIVENDTQKLGKEREVDEGMQQDNNRGKDFEQLTSLILFAIDNFKDDDILELLAYQKEIFGDFSGTCCQFRTFHKRETEFFSKYNSNDLHKFLMLCFEDPSYMWARFFDCACRNRQHAKNFCVTVKKAQPFSNAYFEEMLNEAMHDHEILHCTFFPTLLCEIYFTLYYPDHKNEFFKQYVKKYIMVLLDTEQFDSVLRIINALNLIESYGETPSDKPQNFGEVAVPVLLTVAMVMDKSRYDLNSYTDVRDEVVRACIRFVSNATGKLYPVATVEDHVSITYNIEERCLPLTQYYFQKFFSNVYKFEFDRFLIPEIFEDKTEAEKCLMKNYVCCTMEETEWLAQSERLQPYISNMMLLLTDAVIEANNSNAMNNYRHCVVNYANIVQKFMLPKVENNTKKVKQLIKKVLKIIKSAPDGIYDYIFMSLQGLLLDIAKKCSRPLNEESFPEAVLIFVETMENCQAKELFITKFHALVTELLI